MLIPYSSYIYAISATLVILFQIALAAGLPWGAASMGGKFPGKYPPNMRFAALGNVLVLLFLTLIVLVRGELIFPRLYPFSTVAIWLVVAFSLLGTIMNTITPSKIERIWAPVTLIQFVTSLLVALS